MPDTEGLGILLDNTTFLNFRYLQDRRIPFPRNRREIYDLLHLIEMFLFAERIRVTAYSKTATDRISDDCIRAAESIATSDGRLLLEHPYLDESHRLEIGRKVLDDMLREIGPDLEHTVDRVYPGVDPAGGVAEVASLKSAKLWTNIHRRRLVKREIVEFLMDESRTYPEDFEMIQAVAQNEELVERITGLYKRHQNVLDAFWKKLHLVFRTKYNEILASEQGLRYAPGLTRSSVFEGVHSYCLMKVRTALRSVITESPGLLYDFSEIPSLLEDLRLDVPLLSLGVLMQIGNAPLERLMELRSDEGVCDLRMKLAQVDRVYSENPEKGKRLAEQEVRMLVCEISHRLKLKPPESGPLMRAEIGVGISGVKASIANPRKC